MRKMLLGFSLFVLTAMIVPDEPLSQSAPTNADAGTVLTRLSEIPLAFVKNQGQLGKRTEFRCDVRGASFHFASDEVAYCFGGSHDLRKQLVIRTRLVGASRDAKITGEGLLPHKTHYLLGNDPSRWHTHVPSYSSLRYEEVYPEIDLRYHGDGRSLKYDFIAEPGADVSLVEVKYAGVNSLSVNAAGELVVETARGRVRELKPVAFQPDGGARIPIECEYRLISDRSFGFTLGQGYDPGLPLVVDPTLSYSTYLGGSLGEEGRGIAVDINGSAYVAGFTRSSDFPTEDAMQPALSGPSDAFVAKLNADGDGLVYCTYLGGSYLDEAYGIDVDLYGFAYITGKTKSVDFPLSGNSYQWELAGGMDVFITVLNAAGDGLLYSTYLGGTGTDIGSAIAVDVEQCAYLTGYTNSEDFPTELAFDTDFNGGWYDAFVAKMRNPLLGYGIEWCTYLGGDQADQGRGVAASTAGPCYVTGHTYSTNFPTAGPAFQTNLAGASDFFVTKFDHNAWPEYSTFLGGSSNDGGEAIALDWEGNAYVTGFTTSGDFPTTPGAFREGFLGLDDVAVAKLSYAGDDLLYATYLGGSGSVNEIGLGIDVGEGGNAWVTGWTGADDFPVTVDAFQDTYAGASDAFVTLLNDEGTDLLYSTYLGGYNGTGAGLDYGMDIALDYWGGAHISGCTEANNFPTENAFQPVYAGARDAFVAKFTTGCSCGDLVFRPDPDGWLFADSEPNMWPCDLPWWDPACFWPSWPLWIAAFGAYQCCWDPPYCYVPKPMAAALWGWYCQAGLHEWDGSAYGFAASSLLFFDDYLDVQYEFGQESLYAVPLSDNSRDMVNKYFVYQFGRDQQRYEWRLARRQSPIRALQDCVRMFERAERNDSFLLAFDRHPTHGCVLTPYRCEPHPQLPGVKFIYVYDPVYPGDDTRYVQIDTRDPANSTWSYDGGLHPPYGGTTGLFLSLPMSRYDITPILPRPELLRKGRGVPPDSSYIDLFTSPADSILVASADDTAGCFGDSLIFTLADTLARPIVRYGGEVSAPLGYHLPNGPWSIRLASPTDSIAYLGLLTSSSAMKIERWGSDSTQTDIFRYVGDDSTMCFENPDTSARVYDLQTICAFPDSEIVCEIRDYSLSGVDSACCSISPLSSLQLDNYGVASSYDVQVEISSAAGRAVFYHPDIAVGGVTSHRIVPDWRQYGDTLLILVDEGMLGSFSDTIRVWNEWTSVLSDGSAGSTGGVELEQNYPNPFNPATTLGYTLAAPGGRVNLAVYDVHGRKVRTLVDGDVVGGRHEVSWDGKDDAGKDVPSGIYFYRISTPRGVTQRKAVLLK